VARLRACTIDRKIPPIRFLAWFKQSAIFVPNVAVILPLNFIQPNIEAIAANYCKMAPTASPSPLIANNLHKLLSFETDNVQVNQACEFARTLCIDHPLGEFDLWVLACNWLHNRRDYDQHAHFVT
jgi:hypothetical protein